MRIKTTPSEKSSVSLGVEKYALNVIHKHAVFAYFCSRNYRHEYDAAIAYNDPQINIDWPLPVLGLSEKDAQAPVLSSLTQAQLPIYS